MRILFLGDFDLQLIEKISEDNFVKVIQEPDGVKTLKLIRDMDVVVIRSPHKITQEMLDIAQCLKWIIRAGSGVDNISPSYKEKGIKLYRIPMNSRAVAELVFGMILVLYRNLTQADQSMKYGKWIKKELVGREVNGKSLGILGFGNIGQELALLGESMGMELHVFDRSADKSIKKHLVNRLDINVSILENVLFSSDIIVNCLPLTMETKNLINREALQYVKKDAILINVGRGQIIDIDAVYAKLRDGELAGVGLDVYSKEPPDDHPIFSLDNVICTPHIGAQTVDTKKKIGKKILFILNELKFQYI